MKNRSLKISCAGLLLLSLLPRLALSKDLDSCMVFTQNDPINLAKHCGATTYKVNCGTGWSGDSVGPLYAKTVQVRTASGTVYTIPNPYRNLTAEQFAVNPITDSAILQSVQDAIVAEVKLENAKYFRKDPIPDFSTTPVPLTFVSFSASPTAVRLYHDQRACKTEDGKPGKVIPIPRIYCPEVSAKEESRTQPVKDDPNYEQNRIQKAWEQTWGDKKVVYGCRFGALIGVPNKRGTDKGYDGYTIVPPGDAPPWKLTSSVGAGCGGTTRVCYSTVVCFAFPKGAKDSSEAIPFQEEVTCGQNPITHDCSLTMSQCARDPRVSFDDPDKTDTHYEHPDPGGDPGLQSHPSGPGGPSNSGAANVPQVGP